jgi:hypothetical protein
LDDEYRITVDMKADPFAIDCTPVKAVPKAKLMKKAEKK